MLSDEELRPYVLDLKETLMKGSIVERKSFMRTFIKEIRVDYPRLEVEYTIPPAHPKQHPALSDRRVCFLPKQRNPLNRGGSLYAPDW